MAFEGNLADFKVPDILQLIANQGKSGVLSIFSTEDMVTVGFEEGMVTAAFYGSGGKQAPLEDYLVKSGRLSEKDLERVLTLRRESGLPIEDILVREKYLSEEELIELIGFKIQEVMDWLLTLTEGTFKFEADVTIYKESTVRVQLDVQTILLEGMRRADEWPRIEKSLPSRWIIVGRKEEPILSIEFSNEEKKVLSLLDYDKTVDDLVDLGGLGKFRTYHAIYNLLEVGAAEKKGEATPKEKVGEKAKRAPLQLARYGLNIGVWAGVAIFLFLNSLIGIWVRANWKWGRIPLRVSSEISSQDMEGIRHSLDLYYLGEGRYPKELSELSLTIPKDLSKLKYSPTDDRSSYRLSR